MFDPFSCDLMTRPSTTSPSFSECSVHGALLGSCSRRKPPFMAQVVITNMP
jgi:hypothetical protein